MEFNIKKTFKERIAEALADIWSVFKDMPVTMAMIMLMALFFAIETDTVYTIKAGENFMQYSLPFCVIYVLHSLFIEEVLQERLHKYIAFGYALLPSLFVSDSANYSEEIILGIDKELFYEYETNFFAVYLGILCIYSLAHMYKASGLSLERYCIDTFCALVRSTVVYALFAGGIAIIIWIFDELIFDTHYLLSRIEIFLLAGLFVPAVILALSRKKESYGRFAKLVLLYVLGPMLLLTYLIIYVYIFKIIVTQDMPSNSVFSILASVFAIAMPVWTMQMGIEGDSVFLKLAKIVPFVYIPFILLQIFCIGVRISDYGLTDSRYCAVMLIVFEIIYMILYIMQFVKKQAYVEYIFHVLAVLLVIFFWIPGVNRVDAVFNSQTSRISQLLKIEKPTDDEKYYIYDAYDECRRGNYAAEKRLEEIFTDKELELINSYSEYSDYRFERDKLVDYGQYRSAHRQLEQMDISDYKSIQYVTLYTNEVNSEEELQKVMFIKGERTYSDDKDNVEMIELNAVPVLEYFMSYDERDCYDAIKDMKPVDVGGGKMLYVTEFNTHYYISTGRHESLRISGYLFE